MSTNILGNPETLRKFWRVPHTDLMIKVTGEDGPEYESQLNRFLRKQPCWETFPHVIDCREDPYIPRQYELAEHIRGGSFRWDASKIKLSPSACVPRGNKDYPELWQVAEEFAGKPVCNANILDYLLRFPRLTPEGWKEFDVYFFGTKYHFAGEWHIRYLRWHEINWDWGITFQFADWNRRCCRPTMAAVFEE
ncbi:MAG: hypothetical protein WCG02_00205 [Candidatus Taylorbacteria bacterium]